MSYILGALKKAERERKRDQPLQLEDWEQSHWPPPESSSGNRVWWISGLILLSLIGLILLWMQLSTNASRLSVTEQTESQVDVSETADAPTITPLMSVSTPLPLPLEKLPKEPQLQAVLVPSETENLTVEVEEPPRFSGHLFFPDNSELNRVFSNGSSYRQGEIIDGYRIELIEEDEVLLTRGVENTRVRLN